MILHFITTVLFIYGVKATAGPGMIFEPAYLWIVRILGRRLKAETVAYLMKPLFDCAPCMASFWGSLSYLLFAPDLSFTGWIIWVFALSGFNYIVNKIIS